MDIIIKEQFDIDDVGWTKDKCKRFLRFVQKNKKTRIKKEPGDENHLFLPKYLKLKKEKFYEWKSKDLNNIFVAIFRFLHKYYPEMNSLELQTNHGEKKKKMEY